MCNTALTNKITFFLMTKKGYEVLKAVNTYYPTAIEYIVCSRDNNISNDYYIDIEEYCKTHKIKFFDRNDFHCPTTEYAFAISWRWLIDLSSTKLIVFHDSLLPKYRGFSPLVSALINGDRQIGVTALFATDSYDCGEIISQLSYDINYPIKIQTAIEVVIGCYTSLVLQTINKLSTDQPLQTVTQDNTKATYSLWRDEIDYNIVWQNSSEKINRFINAVGPPYKGAFSMMQNKKVRIFDSKICEDVYIENRTPGKIIFIEDGKPIVVCGTGLLKLIDIIDDNTKQSVLPLKKFRLRFT